MSDKIKPHHLARKAVLYVRQSSAHQVLHNQESRRPYCAVRAPATFAKARCAGRYTKCARTGRLRFSL